MSLALVVACASSEGIDVTRRIVDLLAAGEYGRASALYRQQEALVLSEDAAPTWRRGLDHQNPSVREWSVDALSRIDGEGDFDRVVAMLGDSSRGVRVQARDGLIRMNPERAAGEFRTRLGPGPPEQVALAAQGAAALADAEAVPLLLERLMDAALPAATRGTLPQPLAVIGDPSALRPLVDLAADSGAEIALRRLAAEGAVALAGTVPGGLSGIEPLLRCDDAYIRDLAREASRQP